MAVVTVRELSHNTSAALERVEKGETLEITKHGRIIAEIRPVGIRRRAYEDLVTAGVIGQAGTLADLARLGLPPAEAPDRPTLSRILEDMRNEEPR